MLRNSSSKGFTVIYRRCTVMKNFQRHLVLHRSSPISKVINPKSLDAPRVLGTGTFSTNFSAKSHPQNMEKVTIENILSDANKHRVQKALATSKELMKFPWMYDGKTGRESPRACVLIPFCTVNGEPSVLFTLRATDLNDHQGEVSFPGGKMDPSDNDLIHTAVRECYEELGVPSDRVDVWGMMKSGFPSKAGKYAVWGVIANLGEIDVTDLKLDENEVEEVFTCPIVSLCDPRSARYTIFRIREKERNRFPSSMRNMDSYTMPVFGGQKYQIWGLTAIFLHFSFTICAPGWYNLRLKQ